MKKIFVGNCSYQLVESQLQEFIQAQGVEVSSVKIVEDRMTGRSRGFAFVELSESQDVNQAIDSLNGQELDGRALTVNEAREPKPRFNDGGGDRGGYGGGGDRGGYGGGGRGNGGGGRGNGGGGRGNGGSRDGGSRGNGGGGRY